jgi:hypothetical protein
MYSLRFIYLIILLFPALGWAATPSGKPMASDELGDLANQLQVSATWGEAVLVDGAVKTFKVEAVAEDSVWVQEIFGALQTRPARYAWGQLHSMRDLGPNRLASRRAVFGVKKSLSMAMGMEAVVPGLGYLYAGQGKMALAMWGVTGAAVATAILTGEDGAAGWVPLAVWIKWASLGNLYDDVGAMNSAHREGMALEAAPMGLDGFAGRVSLRF